MAEKEGIDRLSMGVRELKELLGGGLLPDRAYLVRGEPDTGKTTLAMHCVSSAADRGTAALIIMFGETEEHLSSDAESIATDQEGVTVLDLSPTSTSFTTSSCNRVFPADEVER